MKDNTRGAVSDFIASQHLLKKGDHVIVALSGGADSVALLHILISVKEEYDLRITAAHFNHGIRGTEAQRDEDFVTGLCERWGIPLLTERADVPAEAARSGESAELCGRRLRYRFFDRIAAGEGAVIATAHHRDDNAETVLWNLTRGTGIGGLCGIPVRRDNIIRPLLCLSRAEIESYCTENSLDYVTDSTNLSDDYTRNLLRHRVVPVLKQLNPRADKAIAHTAQIMREVDNYFCKISSEELNKAKVANGYACGRLLSLEPIVLQYTVKNFLKNAGAPVDFRHIALIIEAMRSGGTVDLGQGFTVSCAQGMMRFVSDVPDQAGCDISLEEYIDSRGVIVRVRNGALVPDDEARKRITESGFKINSLLLYRCIPRDIITPDTVLRTRRAGDRFTDRRRGVTKTLKKLMNELKIPREKRDTVPVIAEGSTVLWIQGVGVSAQAAADLSRDGELILLVD